MLKKLLVAVIALSFIAMLCSPAMAAKSPNEAKKLWQALPPGQFRDVIVPIDDRHPQGYATNQATRVATPPGQSNFRTPAACSDIYYDCNLTYYWDNVPGAAMRHSAGTDVCSLKRLDIWFYTGGSTPFAAGLTAYVWDDDGFGYPGAVIYSVNVPHGSVLLYPSITSLNIAPANIVIAGGDYHAGYILNNYGDNYRLLSDDGTCGTDRSRYWDGGGTNLWYNLPDATQPNPIDVNWTMTVNACCYPTGASGICADQVYHGPLFYRWGGKDPKAVRFTAADFCTLKTVKLNYSSGGQVGTGGVDVIIYDNFAGLPAAVVGFQHVAHGALTIPGETAVDVSGLGLVFNQEDFHAGVSITNTATDDYQLRSDDGFQGTGRSSIYDLAGGGPWYSNAVAFAPDDYNWLIDANLCCAPPPAAQCFTYDYSCNIAYYWPIPDVYGDDFRNQRFTNATKCTLKTLCFSFYGPGSVGAPGMTAYVWNSDGTFPTTVIQSFPVNPVTQYLPAQECIDVSGAGLVFSGEFHVGYTPIYNGLGDALALLSDDGSCGSFRSSEQWNDATWHLMGDPLNWGIDVNFLITVDVCCQPPGYCDYVCSPTDQWPTFAHDYARTSQSQLTLGELCGIRLAWAYTGATAQNINPGATPVIAEDKVFIGFDNRYVAINLATGIEIWNTKVGALIPVYSLLINNGVRTSPTYEAGSLYLGLGALRGFARVSAATGDTIWVRSSSGGGNPLPGTVGTTRFCNSVISGSEIFFGDDNGQMYSLLKSTGANNYLGQLLNHDGVKRSVGSSPAWDGSRLYWGTGVTSAATSTDGDIHGVTPTGAAFVQDWIYTSPTQPALDEGWSSSPSFRCDNLFIHSAFAFGLSGTAQGFRQNLDPATGIPIWPDYFLMGRALFAPPATVGGYNPMVYFASEVGVAGGAPAPAFRGVRAVNFLNTTIWNNVGSAVNLNDNNVCAPATVTCDPYVMYGTRDFSFNDGYWKVVDGTDGSLIFDYYFTGHMLSTSIATHSVSGENYLVVAERFRNYGATAAGSVFAFKDQGPRPRLQVPQFAVTFTGTNTSESSPVQRTDADAVRNIGCVTLNGTGTLEAGAPPSQRRIHSVNPELVAEANGFVNNLVEYRVEELLGRTSLASVNKLQGLTMQYDEASDISTSLVAVKPADANSSRLAPPSWVSWVIPFSGTPTAAFAVAPFGGSQAFTFEFDRSGMDLLGLNYYFVEISTDDPDYNPEAPLATPQAVIQYTIPYEYCPVDTGRMSFGATGKEWYSNRFEIGDGAVSFEFTLDNTSDGGDLYEGTAYFMSSMDNAAWNPFGSTVPHDFGFLYPFYISGTTCGSCSYGIVLPVEYTTNGGVSYANTIGDVCSFAVIDSLQDAGVYAHQAGPSIGILVKFREVGTYGADFGDFKLIVVDVINRNAGAVNGLYYGMFTDWDVASGANQGDGDVAKGYIFLHDGPSVKGYIGLPRSGSYWPDGSKTDPMYNARIGHNPTEVYPPFEFELDSLYDWTNTPAEGSLTFAAGAVDANGPADDLNMQAAFGKVDLAGFASKQYGFALYGFLNSASLHADTDVLGNFVNKYAGFARGDVDNNDMIDVRDLVRLSAYVASGTNGPVPFKHLGDVDNDGDVDSADCSYLAAYYFTGGPPPKSAFKF
jgi:hypothetical protein